MKKFLFVISMLCFFIFLSANQDVIKEKVEVVNVEVPVRVFLKGQPVDNLKKSDFKLYKDEILEQIRENGFFMKKKKIEVEDVRANIKQNNI
jgi:hypothetical protein